MILMLHLMMLTLLKILSYGFQLRTYIQTLGMLLEEHIFWRVLANQKVIIIQEDQYVVANDLFKRIGSNIIHGWNIV
jgi:hypothetical protein